MPSESVVITGGASGIGYALAKYALQKGYHVFIGDIEESALDSALQSLRAFGKVEGHFLNVAKKDSVENLANWVFSKTENIKFLFNNAGVSGALGFSWEAPPEIFQHAFEVNVMGIIYALQIFIPKMLEAKKEAHVVNIASNAGVSSMPFFSQYQMTKHAVVTLSESLQMELNLLNSNIHVSVACPGFVETNIGRSSRNYPKALQEQLALQYQNIGSNKALQEVLGAIKKGSDANEVAEFIFNHAEKNEFYIFPHTTLLKLIETRYQGMKNNEGPGIGNIRDW